MKRNYTKVIVSVTLVIALLFSSGIQAFAVGYDKTGKSNEVESVNAKEFNVEKELKEAVGENNVTDELMEAVEKDLENLESVGFASSELSLYRITSSGDAIFSMEFENSGTNYLEVKESNNTLYLKCREGTIENILEYRANGDIYLDGNKVTFEYDEDTEIWEEDSDNTLQANLRYSEYSLSSQTSSPYSGTAVATYKTANIDTQKKWANITASVLVGLVAASLSIVASAVVGATVGNYLGSALDSVLTKARAAGYSGNAYLSYKVYRYDSANSTNTNRYSKMYGYYYGKANYTGVKSTHTFYVHNYFA